MATKSLPLLRVGNPWMVGSHVNRVVPLYVLHNVASEVVGPSSRLQAVRDLARASRIPIEAFPSLNSLQGLEVEGKLLQRSAFAVLAPDRRLFHLRAQEGKPGSDGSVTPVLGGLVERTPSDDGLGQRMAELLRLELEGSWHRRLYEMFCPAEGHDPVTELGRALLETEANGAAPQPAREATKRRISKIESNVAAFVDRLVAPHADARRLLGIQELGRGLYFGAVLVLAKWPLAAPNPQGARKLQHLTFVYAGMPPGPRKDPLVLAAARSFEQLITGSWDAMANVMAASLEAAGGKGGARGDPEWERRVRTVLIGQKESEVEALVTALRRNPPDRGRTSPEWCQEILERCLDFPASEFARRIRSLGANIGLAGPDRGRGEPRLYCETPLLGTLVRGVCAGGSLPFESFVTQLREQFGLVFGHGDDDDLSEKLGPIWSGGDGEGMLRDNQEELRRRLVRAGLARSFSDSHTEVIGNG